MAVICCLHTHEHFYDVVTINGHISTYMAIDSFVPQSSYLAKAEYDDSQRQMTITFKTGTQTRYLYVFPATWLSFKQSPDHSSYYSRAVKGKLMAVPLQKHTIGHQRSTPLKQHKLKRGLENGNIHTDALSRNVSARSSSSKRRAGNIPGSLKQ